jgi:hypothetical protein
MVEEKKVLLEKVDTLKNVADSLTKSVSTKKFSWCRVIVFYSEISSDHYDILWVKFSKEFFHWIYRLQEAPKFQE